MALEAKQIQEGMVEGEGYNFSIDASTAGLKPGEWPVCLKFKGKILQRGYADIRNAELFAYKYTDGHSIGTRDLMTILTVYND